MLLTIELGNGKLHQQERVFFTRQGWTFVSGLLYWGDKSTNKRAATEELNKAVDEHVESVGRLVNMDDWFQALSLECSNIVADVRTSTPRVCLRSWPAHAQNGGAAIDWGIVVSYRATL